MGRTLIFGMVILLAACRCGIAQEYAPGLLAEAVSPGVYRLPSVDVAVLSEEDAATFPGLDGLPELPAEAPVEAPAEAPPKLWDGSFELGLDGSEGNSQTFNIRFRAKAKRKSKRCVLSADLDCHKNSNDSLETANRAFGDWRYERLFVPTPWTWFLHGTVEYDEFKAFDLRVAADTGVGYQFIKTKATSLLGRLGGGFSREIGGPDDRDKPELAFGMEFEHQLTKRQKLTAKVDYMPAVTDFDDFRMVGDFGWQALVDEAMNLSVKASLLDRYDSTPEGKRPNDLTYAVTLLWSY